jgi:hypothetical protein
MKLLEVSIGLFETNLACISIEAAKLRKEAVLWSKSAGTYFIASFWGGIGEHVARRGRIKDENIIRLFIGVI